MDAMLNVLTKQQPSEKNTMPILNESIQRVTVSSDFEERARLALATHLNLLDDEDTDFNDITDRMIYDGDIFEADCEEWLIFEDIEAAEEKAAEAIKQSLWAFSAGFLADQTELPIEVFQAIQANEKCEDNNDTMEKIIEATCDLDNFCQAAIDADGAAPFLSQYDDEEVEIQCHVTGKQYPAYRVG